MMPYMISKLILINDFNLKMMLPLCFARLEFKVCKGQPFLN